MSAVGQMRPAGVVAVTASAGGVDALTELAAALPGDFAGVVLVVLHIPPAGRSVLPAILARAGTLPARHPVDGEKLAPGIILVAPPDRHLVVAGGSVGLNAGLREHGHRPSGDVLFRSVARQCGRRAAGVVLSGTMDDGAAGLRAVRLAGGLSLVQDPAEAAFGGMPLAAIAEAGPQFVGPVSAIADQLCRWIAELPDKCATQAPEGDIAESANLTPLKCPDCGGTLWRCDDYGAERFRCRVGHIYSAEGLLVGEQAVLETALRAAIVALEERADVSSRIARRLDETGREHHFARYRDDAAEAAKRAGFLRQLMGELVRGASVSHDEGADAQATS